MVREKETGIKSSIALSRGTLGRNLTKYSMLLPVKKIIDE